MPQLLTIRKQHWANKRQPDMIRGGVLNNPSIVQARYQAKLDALIRVMTNTAESRIIAFFHEPHAEEYFAQDASVASQARIMMNALMKQFNDLFASRAPDIADQTANAADKASSAAIHSSIQELSGGLSLGTRTLTADMRDILTASTAENVALIKSISQQYLQGVQGAVMRSITTGRGLADLVPFLAKHKGITERRALMVARDQSKKLYSQLNKARLQKLGMTSYQWLHTGGSDHPRPLHISYNDRIFRFDEPPIIDENTGERGIPGQAINCRCRIRPVLSFADEE